MKNFVSAIEISVIMKIIDLISKFKAQYYMIIIYAGQSFLICNL